MKSNREKKFFRNCPICDKQLGYVNAGNRDYAEAKGSVCRSCQNTLYKTGRPVSAERNAKISAANKGVPSHYKRSVRDAYTKLYGEKSNIRINKHWPDSVKKRDNYTCVRCNTVASGYKIHAHHVAPKEFFTELAFDISNGMTLCSSCHQKIHYDLDQIVLSGTRLTPVGFKDHAARFIAEGKASSQSSQTPPGYTSVFSPSVTIVKEEA